MWMKTTLRTAGVLLLSCTLLLADDKSTKRDGTNSGPDDVAAVKRVIAARQEYQASLEQLREQYQKAGEFERVRWVEEELMNFHRISKRAYRLDLDVPPPSLTPTSNIPEANELFRRAIAYKGKGWGNELDDNMRRAEILLQQLIALYPQSDKLPDTAYHLGDVYESRAFKQYRRAAVYFERSFQWNPTTNNDSRMRAARLYDRALKDSQHAIGLYKEVINRDSDQKRVEEAKRRLYEMGSTPP